MWTYIKTLIIYGSILDNKPDEKLKANFKNSKQKWRDIIREVIGLNKKKNELLNVIKSNGEMINDSLEISNVFNIF